MCAENSGSFSAWHLCAANLSMSELVKCGILTIISHHSRKCCYDIYQDIRIYAMLEERAMETVHNSDARVAVPGPLETGSEPESLVSPLTPLDAELHARFFRVLSDQTRVRLL